jgi:transposase-like protein
MRSSTARLFWQQHLDAWRASGLRQAEYCRQHGLPPKYMTLWKRKLAELAAGSAPAAGPAPPAPAPAPAKSVRKRRRKADRSTPTLIPVVVTQAQASTTKRSASVEKPRTLAPFEGSLRVTLPNGVGISLELTSTAALPGILRELARLPC